jgi:RNA polymerase subunit RPABC4/transcription elongation factor Spt4
VQIEDIIVQAERVVRVGLIILFTYFVAIWIAAVWWTFQDIRSRTTDALLQIAATLLVIFFNFPGLLIYFLLRPQRTLAELYGESLEEEAILRSMHEGLACPSCQRAVEADFLFCPSCQARLRQTCPRCERPILLSWQLCPYCGASPSTVPMQTAASRELMEPARAAEPSEGRLPRQAAL